MNVEEIKGEEWQDLLKFLAREMKNKKKLFRSLF